MYFNREATVDTVHLNVRDLRRQCAMRQIATVHLNVRDLRRQCAVRHNLRQT
jgi:hypothetical protein